MGEDPNSTEPAALQIRDLAFSYPGAERALLMIRDFRLEPGEQAVVTGSSGGGKSTLLHLVAGLMEPNNGDVLIAGQSLRALAGSARDRFRGRHIGMVFQTFQLLHGFTALENVLAALMFSDRPKGEHKTHALALLERLGIDRPHALAEQLSVGQQQRVAVARAVACEPALVLADEPTASLDEENAAEAVRLLKEACRESGAALMCVTHDRSLISQFDRHEPLESMGAAAETAGV